MEFDAVTLALAIVGAVLGVINTWYVVNRDRVRIKVQPVHIVDGSNRRLFGINAINLSNFSITVEDVGFAPSMLSSNRGHRISLTTVVSLPMVLESRTNTTWRFDRDQAMSAVPFKFSKAYVKTACGRRFTGKSPALKQLSRETRIDPRLDRRYLGGGS